MGKKVVATCMTLAALAAFVPPSVSASPVLTENFTPLPVGASVTAANTGVNTFTAGEGLIATCTKLHWAGTVVQNPGTNVKIEVPKGARFTDSGFAGACTSPSGEFAWSFTTKLCLETVPKTDNITVTGCGTNVAFSIGNCEYSAASMTGTFATNADATITLGEQSFKRISGLFVVGSFPCPTTAKIDLLFDLTTTNGATLSIS